MTIKSKSHFKQLNSVDHLNLPAICYALNEAWLRRESGDTCRYVWQIREGVNVIANFI